VAAATDLNVMGFLIFHCGRDNNLKHKCINWFTIIFHGSSFMSVILTTLCIPYSPCLHLCQAAHGRMSQKLPSQVEWL
jgi:hypothetical protein